MHPVAAAGFAIGRRASTSARGPLPADGGRRGSSSAAGSGPGRDRRRPRRRHGQADAPARADRRAGDRGRAAGGDAARSSRRSTPDAEALDGTAEALPLADGAVDASPCAQAFHWFDLDLALPEIAPGAAPRRAPRPRLEHAATSTTRSRGRSRSCSRRYRAPSPRSRRAAWRAAVEASPLFGPLERRSFAFEQLRDTSDDVVDRVASTSFVAALPPAEREELLVQVRGLATAPRRAVSVSATGPTCL